MTATDRPVPALAYGICHAIVPVLNAAEEREGASDVDKLWGLAMALALVAGHFPDYDQRIRRAAKQAREMGPGMRQHALREPITKARPHGEIIDEARKLAQAVMSEEHWLLLTAHHQLSTEQAEQAGIPIRSYLCGMAMLIGAAIGAQKISDDDMRECSRLALECFHHGLVGQRTAALTETQPEGNA